MEDLHDVLGCKIVVGLACCMVIEAQWLVRLCLVEVEMSNPVCYFLDGAECCRGGMSMANTLTIYTVFCVSKVREK